jgi:hypothetical protein
MTRKAWRVTSCHSFEAHAEAWDACNRANGDLPFLESRFLMRCLEHFGTGRELLAVHGPAGNEDTLLLMSPSPNGTTSTFQPSQLPLGAFVTSAPEALRESRLTGLFSAMPGFPLVIGLTQQDPMALVRPADAGSIETLDYASTGHVDVAGTFEAYWAGRGKNLRQNTAKQLRRLEASGTGATLEIVTRPDEVRQALAEYAALETSGWKQGVATAVDVTTAQGRFYIAMLEDYCSIGRGRIFKLRIGDRIAAMDLCIESRSTQVILKTSYDESFSAVSPATLLRFHSFQDTWSRGTISRIEFFGRKMEWHTRWTDEFRILYHANLYRWPLVKALKQVRTRVRQGLARRRIGGVRDEETSESHPARG